MGNNGSCSDCSPIENVVARIRAEYLEMPGLRLNAAQAQRLWGIDAMACETVLTTLKEVRFLRSLGDGTFIRFESH